MANQVKDPVCGMMIDPEKTRFTSKYQGDSYHFCSADCKEAFDDEHQTNSKPQGHGQHQ